MRDAYRQEYEKIKNRMSLGSATESHDIDSSGALPISVRWRIEEWYELVIENGVLKRYSATVELDDRYGEMEAYKITFDFPE